MTTSSETVMVSGVDMAMYEDVSLTSSTIINIPVQIISKLGFNIKVDEVSALSNASYFEPNINQTFTEADGLGGFISDDSPLPLSLSNQSLGTFSVIAGQMVSIEAIKSGLYNGSFGALNGDLFPTGSQFEWAVTIPEPSRALLLGGSLTGLLFRRRRGV